MGPLHDLRVIDLTGDSGRFATKLLAEAGAAVVRVHDGNGVTHGPAMRADDRGLLDWWYDSGKRVVPLELGSAGGRSAYRRLAARADLIVETLAPGRLADAGLDHADLVGDNPRLVQVSLTPFGRTGPHASWQATDLVAAATGGMLSICGTPEQAVVPWGRQAYAAGSFVATLCGLAGVRSARRSGRGQLVDVSLQEAITASLEQLWFQYNYDDVLPQAKIAPRQGSWHWARAYVVTPARTGWLMVTPTPAPPALLEWLIAEGVPGAADLVPAGQVVAAEHLTPLTELAMDFARRYDAPALFHEAQSRHLAWAEVQGVADLVANPQLAFRGALVEPPGLPGARRPRFPVVFTDTPAEVPGPPAPAVLEEVLERWPAREAAPPAAVPVGAKPLTGIRILDLTWVLAGPFGCRMLGDLGADVLKIQTAPRATGVNDPNHGFYPTFNRSKRSVALDMKAPGALELMRRLVESADVLVENYAAGVLARWGLDWATLRSWNPRLVYVTMSGYGHEGPWRSMLSYGPTIHALCGLTSLSNPPGRGDVGVGYAMNDMAAGAMAAISILAALEARDHTGVGQFVDMAQLEVGAYLVGAALLDRTANGREAVATGNVDPYATHLLDAVVPASDGELAISVRDDADRVALLALVGDGIEGVEAWAAARPAAEAAAALQQAGIPAFRVCNAADLVADRHLGARGLFATLDSPVYGERRFERFPGLWSESVLEPYRRAPAYVGEDVFEVFGELGLDDGAIAEAMADGRLV